MLTKSNGVGRVLIVPDAIPSSSSSSSDFNSGFLGSLVVDRKLVRNGEELHVQGTRTQPNSQGPSLVLLFFHVSFSCHVFNGKITFDFSAQSKADA